MNAETKVKPGGLSAALVKAQVEMTAPRKDREVTVKMKTGGTYKFSYATMAGMVEADKPILAKHGLGFVQFVNAGSMVTRIIHESGDYLDCALPMPNLPNAPQEAGSIITYFKRYSYSAAFGRVADEEDDANIAEGNDYTPRSEAKINDSQLATLQTYASGGVIDAARFCAFFQIGSLKDLPASRYDEAIRMAQAKAAKAKEVEPVQ
jgi:hypothetical protein